MTEDWLRLFPYSNVRHLAITMSNHVPLLIQINNHKKQSVRFKRTFKFENIWMQDEDYQRVIEDSWNLSGINNLNDLVEAMRKCDQNITRWNKKVHGNLQFRI